MSNRILILGSNSFSGSHFSEYVSQIGNKVLCVSRSQRPHKAFLPEHWHYNKSTSKKFLNLNINSDIEKLDAVINKFSPNYVVNFAAQGMVAESWKKPLDWYETNLISQIKLHQILKKLSSMKKYIHVTTPEVYGDTKKWIKESYEFNPSTPYAASRAACDLHLLSFFKGYSFPVIFTRSANVYGPGQQLYRIIPRTILACISGEKVDLHGGGKSLRSFIHIDDVVKATYKICEKGNIGDTYHISTNKLISISQLISKIANCFNLKRKDISVITEDRLGKDTAYKLSSKKIRKELLWRDNIDLETGLKQTIKWVQNYYEDFRFMNWRYIHKS